MYFRARVRGVRRVSCVAGGEDNHLITSAQWDKHRNESLYQVPKRSVRESAPVLHELREVWHRGSRIRTRHHLISGGCCALVRRGLQNPGSCRPSEDVDTVSAFR